MSDEDLIIKPPDRSVAFRQPKTKVEKIGGMDVVVVQDNDVKVGAIQVQPDAQGQAQINLGQLVLAVNDMFNTLQATLRELVSLRGEVEDLQGQCDELEMRCTDIELSD